MDILVFDTRAQKPEAHFPGCARPAERRVLELVRGEIAFILVFTVAHGEHWTKVIGPFLLYMNTGGSPIEMYRDAVTASSKESQHWPYSWVSGVGYPRQKESVSK